MGAGSRRAIVNNLRHGARAGAAPVPQPYKLLAVALRVHAAILNECAAVGYRASWSGSCSRPPAAVGAAIATASYNRMALPRRLGTDLSVVNTSVISNIPRRRLRGY